MLAEYHYRVDRGRVPIPPRCRHKFQDGITLFYVSEKVCKLIPDLRRVLVNVKRA